ncbi:Mitochondrial ATPase complex subunit atp10 [Coemansia spiralis]|nr:Mitochondrial ATPase complex subunit atp10 [Coemansia spiralis]
MLRIPAARLAREAARHGLHSGRAVLAEQPGGKPTTNEAKPVEAKAGEAKPAEAKTGEPKPADPKPAEPAQEKIEYFGNTRFPKPRPKPRRTITPGDAVGQDTPAERAERQPLRQQMEQKMRDVLSPEKNLETRAKIIHDIGHSYFQDIIDLRNNGDKLFEAPAQLIHANRAKYLPSLAGRTLDFKRSDIIDLCRGKTTLLSVDFTKFAERHTRSFTTVFDREFGEADNMQVVYANIEENPAKAVVLALCYPFVKRATPKKDHPNYLIHLGGVEPFRKALGIANPLIGYVFLVDPDMRVRWYANGLATETETETMVRLARSLAAKASKAKK